MAIACITIGVMATAAILVIAPSIAFAQQGTGALVGVVIDDATKAPLIDVIVTVSSMSLQGGQVILSDKSGYYRAPGLPVGEYHINFTKDGYFPNEHGGIQVRSDVTLRVNARLAVAQGAPDNVVIISKPTVDLGSSTTGTTLNADLLRRVPVAAPGGKGAASRSFESVAEVAPGANSDQYGTGINGASSPENHYSIDGLSVGNPGKGTVGTSLSTEFVDEVKVVTAGYMPEYGRATGGILNVVTKSGSNEFHGQVFSYVSPGALEGKRTPVIRAGQSIGYDTKLSYIGDVGFDVGGPIIKDRLWFYTGFDVSNTTYNVNRGIYRTINRTMDNPDGEAETNAIASADYVADARTYQGMAKLTWAINSDHRLTLAAYGTPTFSGGGATFDGKTVSGGRFAIDPLTGEPESEARVVGTYGSTAHEFASMPLDASLKWNGQFLGKRLLLDVMLGTHQQTDSLRAADGSSATSTTGLGAYYFVNWRRRADAPGGRHSISEFEPIANPAACNAAGGDCLVSSYASGAPRDLNEAKYQRYHGSIISSYLANAWGHHLLKAGLDGEFTSFQNTKSNRVFAEAEDGSQFDDEERFGILTAPDQFQYIDPLVKKTSSMTVGGFLQDSWTVFDKVTVNLGVRYDMQIFYNNAGKVGLTLPNQWSPRLGMIYDPTQIGKSKLFVNYARYYENAPLSFADGILAGEPQLHGGHACNAGDFSQQRTTCQDPANLRPNSNETPALPNKVFRSGGAGSALDPDIEASSSDELSFGGEYEILPEARLGFTYTRRWINKWIEDLAPVAGLPGFVGNPGYGVGSFFSEGVQRNYNALTLFMAKNFSRGWLAQGSYTMASLRGNYSGLFAPEDNYLGPNGTADFDSPNVQINRYGALANDFRHTAKVLAAKDWAVTQTQRLGAGVSLKGRSGGATSYLGADPFTYPSESYLAPRGSGTRLPWTFGADLQLSYRITTVKNVGLSFSADVFNILNFQRKVRVNEEYTTSNVIATAGTKPADLPNLKNDEGKAIDVNQGYGTPTKYQAPRVFRFGLRGEY